MNEFTDVPGVDGLKVSRDGRVMRLQSETDEWYEPIQRVNAGGYFTVYHNGKNHLVHRLVAITYVPNPRPTKYKLVRHLNGDPSDNRAENLAWGDAKLNWEDSVRHGTAVIGQAESKLSEDDVLEMIELYKDGLTHDDLAEKYDVHPAYISTILSGKALPEIEREIVGSLHIGERNNQSKLNPDAVREIRRLRKQGLTQREIAERFGVSPRAVRKILSGDTWSHVED